jgi:hypothetical protein
MKKHPLFEVFCGNQSEVYFRLTSQQGETLLVSEAQPNSNAAYRVINQLSDPKFLENGLKRIQTPDKKFTFHIESQKQGVLGKGPVFSQETLCDTCIQEFLRDAVVADIEDYT